MRGLLPEKSALVYYEISMFVLRLLKKYFINFFLWWYLVKGVEVVQMIWRFWLYTFIYLKVWPMLSNLFVPLFQDKSWTGRMIAFPIRLIWGGSGLVIQIFLFGIYFAVGILYFVLPLLPIVEILYFLILKSGF